MRRFFIVTHRHNYKLNVNTLIFVQLHVNRLDTCINIARFMHWPLSTFMSSYNGLGMTLPFYVHLVSLFYLLAAKHCVRALVRLLWSLQCGSLIVYYGHCSMDPL